MAEDSAGLSVLDRPNSYIGKSVPRPNAQRLLEGRGEFVDDFRLPRMLHAAFVRSPHAHARIVSIDVSAAKASPGVAAIVTGTEMAKHCTPWVGVLTHLRGIKSAPQHPLAIDRVCWQGEAVAIVAAATRAEAEDAAELVQVVWEELPAVTDAETALDPATPIIHPELGDNLTFQREHVVGDPDKAFAEADAVVEETFVFGRHTGVTLEPRAILADWRPGEDKMVVRHSYQAPHMMQDLLSRHLGIPAADIRVICRDVGGSFGIKVHLYADEVATCTLAKMLSRPVKFIADRLESFVTDIHARDHRVKGRMALMKDGTITAFAVDDLTGIGPYSMYPRTSGIEANQVVNLTGGPYRHSHYRALARVVFQNKNLMCQYRAVGHPIAMAVTEGLVDAGARAIGMDPAELRRRNVIRDDAYPVKGTAGLPFECLSHQQSLERLLKAMDYDERKAEHARLRARGIHRGIGLAVMIEVTNPGAAFYGMGGARISAQDGASVRMDAAGALIVQSSVTEQGQGTDAILAQIAASSFGVPMEQVKIITGDTDNTPYGGGTWASRAAGIGGEAVLQACKALRENVVKIASVMLQADPTSLDIRDGNIVDKADGTERLTLHEVARIAYFRPDTLPPGFQAEPMATRHYVPRKYPFCFTNGVHACEVEIDIETGFVKLLDFWVVEDCGTPINPQLVDEQVRGGVVQGLGGAMWEECLYDKAGQILNANMADYLVPMAAELPDMHVGHVITPTRESELGAKGAGEAGTAGAPAAVMNAINDALASLGGKVTAMPFTPEKILAALGRV